MLAACAALLVAAPARAEQFVMADVTYEHSTTTTTDSHYYAHRPASAPGNWKSPIDYTAGTAYTHIEVFTKPAGDAPSVWVICFEGSPGYACYWSPVYRTAPTTLDFTFPVKDFVLLGNGIIDWTHPIPRTALILKDDKNVKPAPENVGPARAALYLPTRVRIVVTIVSPGGTYVPPAPSRPDAGIVDAGNDATADARVDAAGDTGPKDAVADAPVDAGVTADVITGTGGVVAPGSGGHTATGGARPGGATTPPSGGGGAAPVPPGSSPPAPSGCSALPGRAGSTGFALVALALLAAFAHARPKSR